VNLYGPLYAVAILVGAAVWWRRLVVRGVPPGAAVLGIGVAAWGGVAGAFGLHAAVAAIPGTLPGGPRTTLRSGSTILGAILGAGTAATAWAAARGERVGDWLDAAAGAAPLAQAIGRLGCLSAGCCYGRPTDSWLALRLPDTSGTVLPRYPAQLIASAADLGILAAVLLAERRLARRGRAAPGALFALYLALYAVKRFLLEFLRGTALPVLLGLTWAQLVAAVLLAGAAAGGLAALRRARSAAPGARGRGA